MTDEHGTEKGYRTGCRCADCKRGHAAHVRAQRQRRRARDAPAPLRALPAAGPPAVAPSADVAALLRDALDEAYSDPDAITRYRIGHAVQLATILDDPAQARHWRAVSATIRELLTDLERTSEVGSNPLADIMAMIRGRGADHEENGQTA